MSVINKMLQDLDKRGAAPGRVEGPSRVAGIELQPGSGPSRWKIAARALVVPLVLAAGWIVLRPDSGSSDGAAKTPQSAPLAEVAPRPTEMQAKADVVALAPLAQEQSQSPALSSKAQTPAATVISAAPVVKTPAPQTQVPALVTAPSKPAVKSEPSAPAAQPQAPAVAAAPVAPVSKPQALAPTPTQAPAVAALPTTPAVKPPAPTPAPPKQVTVAAIEAPKTPVIVAQASVTP